MPNLGLWGDVSHLLQKQHETVFLVVKSYIMWVSGGVAYMYIYTLCIYTDYAYTTCIDVCVYVYAYMYMNICIK